MCEQSNVLELVIVDGSADAKITRNVSTLLLTIEGQVWSEYGNGNERAGVSRVITLHQLERPHPVVGKTEIL